MSMSIEIKEAEFRKIITALDKEIENISRTYEEIKKESKKFDGTDDIWKGKTQKAVNDYYQSVAVDFPDTLERLTSLSTYLKKTLENYIAGENSINNDVETNKENLDIN